jgi:WD40 repeat protein/energy-coupling factor transporter ATP-binding protein EcfA2
MEDNEMSKIELPFRESHAFIVGINEYPHLSNLRTAVNDAERLGQILEEEQGFCVHPPLLNASKKEIEKLLGETMPQKVKAEDRCLFYFAGHGEPNEDEKRPGGYIIPSDAKENEPEGYISMTEVYDAFQALPCKHGLLILDCCFAGTIKWANQYRHLVERTPKRLYIEHVEQYVRDPAWQILVSAANDQKAKDVGKDGHSPFIYALLKGLQGEADLIIPGGKGDGVITATELYFYLRQKVEKIGSGYTDYYRQTPGLFPMKNHDKGEFVFINPQHPINLKPRPQRNPFKGLERFGEKDVELFYGRDKAIEELMLQLEINDLVVLSGASGSGKSSLLEAGIIPRLKEEEKKYEVIPLFRVGEHSNSIMELREVLNDLLKPSLPVVEKQGIIKGCEGLLRGIQGNEATILQGKEEREKILIIDQMEALMKEEVNEEEKRMVIQKLYELVQYPDEQSVKIILSLRSDNEKELEKSGIQPDIEKVMYRVPPLELEELREVLMRPAIQTLFDYEPPGMVDQIIEEVLDSPGALALLSLTMSEMYRYYIETGRTNRTFRLLDYEGMGGVTGVISKRAQGFYNSLELPDQKTMLKILMRMVAVEEGQVKGGKRVNLEELCFSRKENLRVPGIIDRLVEERLIVKDIGPGGTGGSTGIEKNNGFLNKDEFNNQTDTYKGLPVEIRGEPGVHPKFPDSFLERDQKVIVEPAHKGLITNWGTLMTKVLDYGTDQILLLSDLNRQTRKYNSDKKKKNLWSHNPNLTQLWKELRTGEHYFTVQEVIFLEESIKQRTWKRRRNCIIGLVIVVLSFFGFTFFKAKKATDLANQAQLKLKEDPIIASRMIMEAHKWENNWKVKQVLTEISSSAYDYPFYQVCLKHDGKVNDAVFSPDGTMMLTSSSDYDVRLWDVDGKQIIRLPHQNVVYSSRFSPKGDKILTQSKEKMARLWNLKGELLASFEHERSVTSAQFFLDGNRIMTASQDRKIKIWSVSDYQVEKIISVDFGVKSACLSPTGQEILAGSNNKSYKLIDLHSNSLVEDFRGVIAANYSSKGEYIFLVFLDHSARIWDTKGRKYLNTFYLEPGGDLITYSAFFPEGDKILVAYDGGDIMSWNIKNKSFCDFKGHQGNISSIEFSPSHTHILTASTDGTAKLWDFQGHRIVDFNKHKDSVTSAVFSSDGSRVLTASSDHTAKVWPLKEQPVTVFSGHGSAVQGAYFSPNGRLVLTTTFKGVSKLWDQQGNLKAVNQEHKRMILDAAFSPDGSKIITSSADSTAKLWNLEGKLLQSFDLHTDNVNSVRFSPDGLNILTASSDGTARMWDLRGTCLCILDKHTSTVNSAVFSPEGDRILTASYDQTAKLWDLQGNLIHVFPHGWSVESAVYSPDGTYILTISLVARIWDLEGGLLAQMKKKPREIKNVKEVSHSTITYAVFSPDGKKVLTASNDNFARLWDLNGDLITEFEGHKVIVKSAVFSPDGMHVLTASADQTIKLWDLKCNLLSNYNKHQGVVNSAIFSPDGTRILSASEDGNAALWHTPESFVQWLKEKVNLESNCSMEDYQGAGL